MYFPSGERLVSVDQEDTRKGNGKYNDKITNDIKGYSTALLGEGIVIFIFYRIAQTLLYLRLQLSSFPLFRVTPIETYILFSMYSFKSLLVIK